MNPFEDYISELEMLGRKPSYIRSIRGSANDLCAVIGCDTIDPVQITERDIKAWIQAMRSRNLSDASIYENVGAIYRFFNFMIESQIMMVLQSIPVQGYSSDYREAGNRPDDRLRLLKRLAG